MSVHFHHTHSNIIRGNMLRFFRERNATSKERAIELSKEDWIEIGLPYGYNAFPFFSFGAYSFLHKTDENTFWIDIEQLKNSSDSFIRLFFLLFLVIAGIAILVQVGSVIWVFLRA